MTDDEKRSKLFTDAFNKEKEFLKNLTKEELRFERAALWELALEAKARLVALEEEQNERLVKGLK